MQNVLEAVTTGTSGKLLRAFYWEELRDRIAHKQRLLLALHPPQLPLQVLKVHMCAMSLEAAGFIKAAASG